MFAHNGTLGCLDMLGHRLQILTVHGSLDLPRSQAPAQRTQGTTRGRNVGVRTGAGHIGHLILVQVETDELVSIHCGHLYRHSLMVLMLLESLLLR